MNKLGTWFSWKAIGASLLGFAALSWLALYNFLIFHSLAEIISITIAWGVFMVAWNARRYINNDFFLLLGVASLLVGTLDALHILAFQGMHVFPADIPSRPSQQYWIAARAIQSASLIGAMLALRRRVPLAWAVGVLVLATALALVSIPAGLFPDCYVEGTGLTPFKVGAEYAITGLFVLAALLLHRNRAAFDPSVFRRLLLFALAMAASELFFISYSDPHDANNFLGHVLKIGAFAFLYKAIVETGLTRPMDLVFQKLQQEIEKQKQSEAALIESRQMLLQILDTIPVRLFWKDLDLRYLGCNSSFANDAGLASAEQMVGRSDLEMTWAEQAEMYRADDRRVLETGRSKIGYEEPQTTPDGRRIWVQTSKVPLRDAHGAIKGVLGTYEDITERKRSERILKLNEARYRALLSLRQMPDATMDELLRAVVDKAVELSGSEVGYFHFVQKDQVNLDLLHWSSGVERSCAATKVQHYPLSQAGIWADCVRTGKPALHNDYASAPGRRGLPQGHVPLVRHLSVPVLEDGGVCAVLGVGNKPEPYDEIDVEKLQRFVEQAWQLVARHKAEDAFRASQALLRQTQALGKIGGWRYNLDTGEGSWTEQTFTLLGLPQGPAPAPGATAAYFDHKDWGCLEMAFRQAASSGIPFDIECGLAPMGLNLRWVRVVGRRADEGGQRILSGMIQDVTDRKHLECLREDMDRIARHDLKTPLNAVMGFSQILLMDDGLTDEQRRNLQHIVDAGGKMLSIINISLDLYRMEQGVYEFVPGAVDLRQVLDWVLVDLAALAGARRCAVELRIEARAPDASGRCVAVGEELLCYSVLSNLVKNALESSPVGGAVTVTLCRDKGCRVSIRNAGEIPEEFRGRFFEKYATFGKKGGTGLGTYSAKLMIETMGGSIQLDCSTPGETTVVVSLPGEI